MNTVEVATVMLLCLFYVVGAIGWVVFFGMLYLGYETFRCAERNCRSRR